MSYSDFLRTRQINAPKIVDVRQRYGDASNHIWNKKLATTIVSRPSHHVITNQSDPFLSTPSTRKIPVSYAGSGSGGKVPDASSYTLSLGARSIASDVFSSTKLVIGGGTGNKCLASPAPSLVINESGNTDRIRRGLNMGDVVNTCPNIYNPLTKSYFVDTLPDIKNGRIGILPSSRWNGAAGTNYGTQLPITAPSTMTTGNWSDKDERTPQVSLRPPKTDFVTEPTGPQVSANGAFGRAPKIGNALPVPKYVEKHHGSIQVNLPKPSPYKPDQGGNYVPSRTA